MVIIQYLVSAFLNAGLILIAGIVPWILTAWSLNHVSGLIQRRLCFLGDRAFIFLTAPGVVVHELSHAAFCLLFRHKITNMNLFSPKTDGTLGYVVHQYGPKSLYQRAGNFFIGTGPIWGGLFLLYYLSELLLPKEVFSPGNGFPDSFFSFLAYFFSLRAWTSVSFYLWLYAALSISAHITLSPPDIQGAKDGFLIFTGVIILSCLLFGWCGTWENDLIHGLTHVFVHLFPLIATITSAQLILAAILRLLPFTGRNCVR